MTSFPNPAAIRRARRDPGRFAVAVLSWTLASAPAMPPTAVAADHPRDAAARPLTVAVPDENMQDALQRAFFGPFAAQNRIGVRMMGWDGTLRALQGRARTGGEAADLILMDDSSVLLACRQGLLLPLRAVPAAPGGGKGGRPDGRPGGAAADGVSRCGRGALRTTLVLAWDKSRIDAAPGWAEFWDVARRPGRRGLARGPRGTLEIALLADGVPADEVYAALGSPDGVDRAFRKLDQLKPYVVWWSNAADAARIMQAGAVLMTSAPSGDVQAADLAGHRDFAVQWQGSISTLLSWAVPGRPAAEPAGPGAEAGDRLARAEALLAFVDDPARQAALAELYPAGIPAPGAPSMPAGDGPGTPQHPHEALRQDDAFWAAHLEALQARFEGWIGQPAGSRPAP